MQDDRLRYPCENAIVDLDVVVGRFRTVGKCTAGHQNDLPTLAFDKAALLLVVRLYISQRDARGRSKLVSSSTTGNTASNGSCLGH